MNKKPQRSNVRAPTTQPAATIAPSGTLALDGEFPLSASNGVTAPEPLAAHDVLHAAMVPREGEQPEADAPATDATDADASASVADAPQQDAPDNMAAGDQAGSKAKKAGKKAGKVQAKAAEKVVKDKFVKCTFSLPESEMLVLNGLKKTHQVAGAALKKSQLLRVALLALADIDAARLAQLVAQLPAEPAVSKKKK